MPGMGTGLQVDNATIASAFRTALLHQALVVLGLLFLLALAFNVLRARQLGRARAGNLASWSGGSVAFAEPVARRALRVGFGLLWIFDGVLQGQWSMPLGLPSEVMQPAALTSPAWVQHLVNGAGTIWNNHPITAASSAVWIQVGLGLFLLVAPRGIWSRLAGASSVVWGLLVWVFGESFGGIFAPGLTWLFGAPGAVLFYCLAGVLVALPERAWATPRLGRLVLGGFGLFFVGMAVLQAWPGRGFWVGRVGHRAAAGTLASMTAQMARTPQPKLLASWVAAFSRFDSAHGFAVNLFVVVALGVVGLLLLPGRGRLARAGLVAGLALCLADWVLVEDLGFLGGVGTDPNSMVPMALLLVVAYLALVRLPAEAEAPVPLSVAAAAGAGGGVAGRLEAFRRRLRESPGYVFRSLAAVGALVVVLLGAVPMAVASTNSQADAIVSEAIDGTPQAVNVPAPDFRLVDQNGRDVSLAFLRSRTVVFTFLDPVCVFDCPLIAQELRQADSMLGPRSRHVALVAVVANPIYRSRSYVRAFDRQEGLVGEPNWLYLTGSLKQLELVWSEFGIEVLTSPAGAMVGHSDMLYVIDPRGRIRYIFDSNPGAGTPATRSSFASTLVGAVENVLARP